MKFKNLKSTIRHFINLPKSYFMNQLYLEKVIRDRRVCHLNLTIIAGMPRSGTSLLSAILNAHPEIFCPSEHPLLLKQPFSAKFVANKSYFDISEKEVLKILRDAGWTNLIETLINNTLIKNEKSTFATKTPGYIFHFYDIMKYFPNSRWLLVYRDGRDVVPSLLKHQQNLTNKTINYEQAIHIWRGFANAILAIKNHPACHLVSYESMVHQSQETLEAITKHLRLPFSESMLFHEKQDMTTREDAKRSHHTNLCRPIDKSQSGKWQNELSPEEIDIFWKLAEYEMLQLGYKN